MQSRIRELEKQFDWAQTLPPSEKAALEVDLVRFESNKDEAIRVSETTHNDLAKTTEQVVSLTQRNESLVQEKDNLEMSYAKIEERNRKLGQ